MTPIRYFALIFLTIIVLVIVSQVPLAKDFVAGQCGATSWCSSSDEFWGGVGTILVVIYTFALAASGGK